MQTEEVLIGTPKLAAESGLPLWTLQRVLKRWAFPTVRKGNCYFIKSSDLDMFLAMVRERSGRPRML